MSFKPPNQSGESYLSTINRSATVRSHICRETTKETKKERQKLRKKELKSTESDTAF